MLHVGVAVRLLRVSQRLTIPQLAEEAGVNPKTISKIERGEVNCTVSVLGAIARALGCPDSGALEARLDEWCEQRIGPRQMKADWREVITLWDRLSAAPESQRVILAFLRREVRLLPQRAAAESHGAASATGQHPRSGTRAPAGPRRQKAHELPRPEESSSAASVLPLSDPDHYDLQITHESGIGTPTGDAANSDRAEE